MGALAFGVGTLWVYPYIGATKAQAYLWLTAQQENQTAFNGNITGGFTGENQF